MPDQQTDEFGIPIKKSQSQTDEFGIPIKKKADTVGSSIGATSSSHGSPTSRNSQPNGNITFSQYNPNEPSKSPHRNEPKTAIPKQEQSPIKNQPQKPKEKETGSWGNIGNFSYDEIMGGLSKDASSVVKGLGNFLSSDKNDAIDSYLKPKLLEFGASLEGLSQKHKQAASTEQLPNTATGSVTSGLIGFTPDLIELAGTPELEITKIGKVGSVLAKYGGKYAPKIAELATGKFPTLMGGKGFVEGYNEASSQGKSGIDALNHATVTGLKEMAKGDIYELGGEASGKLIAKPVAEALEKSGFMPGGKLSEAAAKRLINSQAQGVVFSAIPFATNAIDGKTTSIEDVKNNYLFGSVLGAFHGVETEGGKPTIADAASTEILNREPLIDLHNFMSADIDAIKDVHNSEFKAVDLKLKSANHADNAFHEEDPDKKQADVVNSSVTGKMASIKSVTDAILKDKEGVIDGVAELPISDEGKQALINKVNEVHKAIDPIEQQKTEIGGKITELEDAIAKNQDRITNATDPIDKADADVVAEKLSKEKDSLEKELRKVISKQYEQKQEPVPTVAAEALPETPSADEAGKQKVTGTVVDEEGKRRDKAIDAIKHGIIVPERLIEGDVSGRFDLGMSTAEKKKAVSDINKGNYDTEPAKKLIDKVVQFDKDDNYPIIEGTGGTSVRSKGATAKEIQQNIDDAKQYRLNKLSDSDIADINKVAAELGITHEDVADYEEYRKSTESGNDGRAPEIISEDVRTKDDKGTGDTKTTGDKKPQGEPPKEGVKTAKLEVNEDLQKSGIGLRVVEMPDGKFGIFKEVDGKITGKTLGKTFDTLEDLNKAYEGGIKDKLTADAINKAVPVEEPKQDKGSIIIDEPKSVKEEPFTIKEDKKKNKPNDKQVVFSDKKKNVSDEPIDDSGGSNPFTELKNIWLGNIDVAHARANSEAANFQKDIQATIPKVKRRWGDKSVEKQNYKDIDQAIHIYLDLKRNPGHLKAFYDKLTPDQKKIVDLSQNLTDAQKEIADKISDQYKLMGETAKDEGLIKDVVDNYVSRAWDFKGKPIETVRKFGINTKHSLQRSLDTILEGWAKGYDLKIKGAANNLAVLKQEIATVIENKNLISEGSKIPIDEDENKLFITHKQDGYELINNPSFKKWGYAGKVDAELDKSTIMGQKKQTLITEDGTVIEKKDIYAPKIVADRLNNILAPNRLSGYKFRLGGATLLDYDKVVKFNSSVKQNIFLSSFFHHLAFIRNRLLSGNISKGLSYKEGLKAIHEMKPEYEMLVRNGMTTGKIQDWDELALQHKGAIRTRLEKYKYPKAVIDKISDLAHNQKRFLFERFGSGMKVMDGINYLNKEIKRNPGKDPNEIARVVANAMNNNYGGIHLKQIERNATTQSLLQAFLMAPDWTESNLRMAGNAFKRGYEADFTRRMWTKVALRGASAVALANLAMAFIPDPNDKSNNQFENMVDRYKRSWDEGGLNWTKLNISPLAHAFGAPANKDYYFSIFGHYTDPIRLAASAVDLKGGSGLKFFLNKGSVIVKTGKEALTSQDWKGQEYTTIDQLLGIDDDGQYQKFVKATDKHEAHYPGDDKGGQLSGKTTAFKFGSAHPLNLPQIPSFVIDEVIGMMPTQIQGIWQYGQGQTDGFTTMSNFFGAGTTASTIKHKTDEAGDFTIKKK